MKQHRFRLIELFEISNSVKSICFWSVISLILVAVFLVIVLLDQDLYINLAREGTNTELLTAIFYFIAGGLIIIHGYRQFKLNRSIWTAAFPLLFGGFFIFIAGEEESWGQWIFHYKATTWISEANVQKEINIHNLALLDFLSPHMILNIFALTVGIVLPLLYRFSIRFRMFLNKMHFPVCPLSCLPLFFLALGYERISGVIFYHWASAEIREFLLSIGFLLFSFSAFNKKNIIE